MAHFAEVLEAGRASAVLAASIFHFGTHTVREAKEHLRAAGLPVEFFPEPKKLGQQLKLASKRRIPLALVIGSDEFAAGTAQLKDMAAETATTIAWGGDEARLVAAVQAALAARGSAG